MGHLIAMLYLCLIEPKLVTPPPQANICVLCLVWTQVVRCEYWGGDGPHQEVGQP